MTLLPLGSTQAVGPLRQDSPEGIYVRVFMDGSEGGRYRQSPLRLERLNGNDAVMSVIVRWDMRKPEHNTLSHYRRIE